MRYIDKSLVESYIGPNDPDEPDGSDPTKPPPPGGD